MKIQFGDGGRYINNVRIIIILFNEKQEDSDYGLVDRLPLENGTD